MDRGRAGQLLGQMGPLMVMEGGLLEREVLLWGRQGVDEMKVPGKDFTCGKPDSQGRQAS